MVPLHGIFFAAFLTPLNVDAATWWQNYSIVVLVFTQISTVSRPHDYGGVGGHQSDLDSIRNFCDVYSEARVNFHKKTLDGPFS